MEDLNTELSKWFEELQKLPVDSHLLCPKINNDDDEDYGGLSGTSTASPIKEKRIQDGQHRIEVTYWNSLILGFDKKDAGEWLTDFTARLETCLKFCPECVLNWHMQRKRHLRKFSVYD